MELERKLAQVMEQLRERQKSTETAEPAIIEALKQQIQICMEDFESERRDREKVQSKLHRALSESDHLKKEVRLKVSFESFGAFLSLFIILSFNP